MAETDDIPVTQCGPTRSPGTDAITPTAHPATGAPGNGNPTHRRKPATAPAPHPPAHTGHGMADNWLLHSFLELGALPGAVPSARVHARQRLWEWGQTKLTDNAELVGCSTLKWPHCSPLIWPHPGAVAAGLLHSDLAPPARLGRRIFRHAGEVPGQAGCLGGLLVTSGCRPLTVWGRDGVEGGAVRRDPLGLPAGGVRRPGAGPQVRRAPADGAAGDRLAAAAGPQAAGAGGAGAGGGRR